MKTKQTTIAKKAGISPGFLSSIVNGKRDPSANVLRALKKAMPWTSYDLWIDGTPEEKWAAFINGKPADRVQPAPEQRQRTPGRMTSTTGTPATA